MQRQQSLFNTDARDEAISQVRDNADPDWRSKAERAVTAVALKLTEFTSDRVWEELGGKAGTHEPRAMGAIMVQCASYGLIEPTDRFQVSSDSTCHNRPKRIWRSLLVEGVKESI